MGKVKICRSQNPTAHVSAGPLSPRAESKGYYFALWHFRNCNLNSESLQISTRQPKTPTKAIGTLLQVLHTGITKKSNLALLYQRSQSSLLSGMIEGSQTHVTAV